MYWHIWIWRRFMKSLSASMAFYVTDCRFSPLIFYRNIPCQAMALTHQLKGLVDQHPDLHRLEIMLHSTSRLTQAGQCLWPPTLSFLDHHQWYLVLQYQCTVYTDLLLLYNQLWSIRGTAPITKFLENRSDITTTETIRGWVSKDFVCNFVLTLHLRLSFYL